jgi:DNA polymerase-3 subunit beta
LKALINRKGLLAAFQGVSGVAPSKSPKPILESLKFIVGEDGSTLMATDLAVGVRYRVLGVKVDRPGSVILPTAKMQQILATSTDDELSIESDDVGITVTGIRSKFRLPSEDPDLFPEVPEFDTASYFAVGAADLRRLIRRTSFATDVESTRYALGGCLVEVAAESIAMIATDGRRLAKMVGQVEAIGEPTVTGSPVLPVKALKLIDRNIDDDDTPVHLSFSPQHALIRTDSATTYTRLVEGRFPRYQDVFPTAPATRIPLEVGPLRLAVEQATIATSDESRGVDFTFGNGSLVLSSQAADVGSSTIELPIDYDGSEIVITFDPQYLAAMLKVLDPSSGVVVELIDHKSACVIVTDDSYKYVIMPLTRSRD